MDATTGKPHGLDVLLTEAKKWHQEATVLDKYGDSKTGQVLRNCAITVENLVAAARRQMSQTVIDTVGTTVSLNMDGRAVGEAIVKSAR